MAIGDAPRERRRGRSPLSRATFKPFRWPQGLVHARLPGPWFYSGPVCQGLYGFWLMAAACQGDRFLDRRLLRAALSASALVIENARTAKRLVSTNPL